MTTTSTEELASMARCQGLLIVAGNSRHRSRIKVAPDLLNPVLQRPPIIRCQHQPWPTLLVGICMITLVLMPSSSSAILLGCEFDGEWFGQWFVQGERDPVEVSIEDFGGKGLCYRRDGHIHVIFNRADECYQCLTFHDRHTNILELQEGPCEPAQNFPDDDLPPVIEFCNEVKHEPMKTMVRLDREENIECPFSGSFQFTYRKGNTRCNILKSRAETCMTRDQMAFRFNTCHEDGEDDSNDLMIGTLMNGNVDDGVESLTCLGNWTTDDGLANYLVGVLDVPFVSRLEEKIKCLLYAEISDGGFKIAQSPDASCSQLKSFRDGIRTLHLDREKPHRYHYQLVAPDEGTDLPSGSLEETTEDEPNYYHDNQEGTEVVEVSDSETSEDPSQTAAENGPEYGDLDEGDQRQGEDGVEIGEDGQPIECKFPAWATDIGTLQSFSLTSQYSFSADGSLLITSNYSALTKISHQMSVTKCILVLEEVEDSVVKMIAKITAGCDTKFKCMYLFKRTENVLEVQEGQSTNAFSEACSETYMQEDRQQFITLLRPDPPVEPCSADGFHNVTSLNLKGITDPCDEGGTGFQELSVKCRSPELVVFMRTCNSRQSSVSEFLCIGGWEQEVPYDSLQVQPPEDNAAEGFTNGLYHFSKAYYDTTDQVLLEDEEPLPENVTLGYMVAYPNPDKKLESTPLRICIIYAYFNNTYSWTVDTRACVRNIVPGSSGLFRFNSTKLESCGAVSHFARLPTLSAIFAQFLFLWFSSSALADASLPGQ